jgi:hypothetical protein
MRPGSCAQLLLALALACGSSASPPAGGGGTPGGGTGGAGGGGAGGAGGTGGSSVALEAFSDTLAMAYCQREFQCCSVMDLTQESCRNEIKGQTEVLIEDYQPFVASGKVIYRAEKAAACINMMLAASCATFMAGSPTLNNTALCLDAFEATVAPGGACSDDVECNAGWCDVTAGKCVAKKATGSCEDDADCLSENCSPTSMMCEPRMVEGLCL